MEFIKANLNIYVVLCVLVLQVGCNNMKQTEAGTSEKVELVVIEPQHFHAALVQKYPHEGIGSEVYLYAESANKVEGYQQLIAQYNSRAENPTAWKINSYYGDDFLEAAFQGTTGNVVVLAGDNQQKITYIEHAVAHGRDVFADKPLVIDNEGFQRLKTLLNDSEKSALVYDIMTERYDVKNQVIKHLINDKGFSGGIQQGEAAPSIQFNSTHHFIKEVSGSPLIRPAMFYNTKQQGEGLVDVTTHYIDLVQWMLSSEQPINIESDIHLLESKRWATRLTKEDFVRSTGLTEYTSSLQSALADDGSLNVFSNGQLHYTFKGVPVSISVEWVVESLDGSGDQFFAKFSTKEFNIEVKPDQNGTMSVFLQPHHLEGFEEKLKRALTSYSDFPGLSYEKEGEQFKITIPTALYLGHEDHFAKVLEQFLTYRNEKQLPEWERSFILAKYYLTTKALENAK